MGFKTRRHGHPAHPFGPSCGAPSAVTGGDVPTDNLLIVCCHSYMPVPAG